MVDPLHPFFSLLLIVKGLMATLNMASDQIEEALEAMAQTSKESILETIVALQSALSPSYTASTRPKETPLTICEGGGPSSSPAPPSGKGKEVLIAPTSRKDKIPYAPPPSGPKGSSI